MDNLLKRLEEIVDYTLRRHEVLTGNLANSDTPGYKAKDVEFESLLDEEKMRLKRTSPLHIRAFEAGLREVVREDGTPPWLDENNVEEDVEMAKITENAILYQATLRLMNNRFKMYKMLFTGR
ncbi:MAG TPA: flagellar basal body rod protein FlgB [Nitrospirae bacterium]|nr:flagellar basal body rod protein FlgB [Nitrospirota bacterium]